MTQRVLVVDDSLTVRMDLSEALAGAGFVTELAADLASARESVRRGGCSLVVLDLLLPDGEGLDFLKELRSAPETASLPVMLLSTEAEVGSRIQGMSAGADEYVGKPYDLAQLVARASKLCGGEPRRQTSRRRVLLIDDSPTFRDRLREALEEAGYDTREAGRGEEGLSLALSARPDAIIVDGMLPGIDGVTVIRRLKADTSMRGVPCLLLTAEEGPAAELRALDAGADAYIRKAEDLTLILVKLGALLRGAPTAAEAHSSLLGPKRLLAVDDSPTYLDALATELREDGYDVALATSGEEALAFLAAQPVDCILLDLMMPGLSGHETCRRIKESPDSRDIPLVMLTARDDRAAMIEGINAGADDYIAKSSDFGILKARLRAQLRRKHFEDENRHIREKLVRRETEGRFQQLIHSSLIGVMLGEVDGVLSEANEAFLRMLGWTRAALQAGEITWARLTPDQWRDHDRKMVEQLRQGASIAPFEKELLRKDGSRLPVLFGMVQLRGVSTIACFVLDLTERKQDEAKLQAYAAALEQSNREAQEARRRAEEESQYKSRFLANMSHELRTPLNAIIGFSELLEQELFGPLNPKQLDYIRNVLTGGRHLLTLVNDILDLSKIAAGRMTLQLEVLDIGALMREVGETLSPVAGAREVTVTFAIEDGLPPAELDAVRMRQVIFNLLSNAIKFTGKGGSVTLSAARQGTALRIACQDTGIGIKPEDLPRLFREFEQIEPQLGPKPEGTGLGLALTRRLVELHGGSVSVESVFGQGSTFSFTLPLRQSRTNQ